MSLHIWVGSKLIVATIPALLYTFTLYSLTLLLLLWVYKNTKQPKITKFSIP